MSIPAEATDTEKRMCRNKVAFDTILEAYRFIERRKRNNKPMSDNSRTYKCPFCKKLHLTTKPKEEKTTSNEYCQKVLVLQGFDALFSERFISHLKT